uniref:Uncharacterized protein n=1 Tax=Opuntia streptacantha TaxID=393608 RepID=A0A7C8YDX4_OPUST
MYLHRATAAQLATPPLPAIPAPFSMACRLPDLQHHQTQPANINSLASAAVASVIAIYRYCCCCSHQTAPPTSQLATWHHQAATCTTKFSSFGQINHQNTPGS